MDTLVKIFVVKDEMLIGAKFSMWFTNMGYEVTGTLPSGEQAIMHVEENRPDIILLDINFINCQTCNGVSAGLQTPTSL